MEKNQIDISKKFLHLSRILLAERPIFAQLLASMTKVARPELKSVFALDFHQKQALLYYQADHLTRVQENGLDLALSLQEEFLHVLLQHPIQQEQYPIKWAFHLAADLEVLQWLDQEAQAGRHQPLIKRLQLSPPWKLDVLYHRLLELEKVYGFDQVMTWQMQCPMSRAAHQYWQEDGVLTNEELERWLAVQLPLLTKLFPAHPLWRQIIVDTNAKLDTNWQLALQRFAQRGARTVLRSSHRRPSKRYGTFPGTRRKRQQILLIIIDTSGSIDDQLLGDFFQQIQQLYQQGATITVVEADHQVGKTYRWNGQLPQIATGGGHTDFNPALQYANESGPYDGIVYFTDGEAHKPDVVPAFPLLWCITAETENKDWADWPGRVVHID